MKVLSTLSTFRAAHMALALLAASCCLLATPAHALRIKEVASVQGVRSNQLTGYGLVVGLDGTGDQTTQMPYTTQTLSNYLQQMGITLPATANTNNLQLKNVAAVHRCERLLHGQCQVAQGRHADHHPAARC